MAGGVCCPLERKSLSPPFPKTCTRPRPPSPTHYIHTGPPPRRGGALRGSGGERGRWNVRNCRSQNAPSSSETPNCSPPFSKPRELASSQGPEWRNWGRRGPLCSRTHLSLSPPPPLAAEPSAPEAGERAETHAILGGSASFKVPRGRLSSEGLGHTGPSAAAAAAAAGPPEESQDWVSRERDARFPRGSPRGRTSRRKFPPGCRRKLTGWAGVVGDW